MKNMSELIIIKSKISDSDLAYELNTNTCVMTKHANFSMTQGTIVKVQNLFYKNMIRKNELMITFKRDAQQILDIFENYSILYNEICFNFKIINSKGIIENVFSKPILLDQRENISYLIKNGLTNKLTIFQHKRHDFSYKGYFYISDSLSSDFKKSKYYFYVNLKPVLKIKSFVTILKEFLIKKSLKSKILLIIMIECNKNEIIGNLEKSKYKIILKNEKLILDSYRDIIIDKLNNIYDKNDSDNTNNETIEFYFKENIDDSKIKTYSESKTFKLIIEDKSLQSNENNHLTNIDDLNLSNKKINYMSNEYINDNKLQISKKDLNNNIVLGQFNKGFIICKSMKDNNILYVVDQHASDEKYNYERQLKSLSYQKQLLAVPVVLRLNSSQLNICKSYMDIINEYGFSIEIKQDSIEVLSKPYFQEKIVDTNEIFDLLNYLKNDNSKSKESFVFARINKYIVKNACRYSTMIRDTLSMNRMREIVENLGRLDAPFNCPHGRPTIISISSPVDNDLLNNYLFQL